VETLINNQHAVIKVIGIGGGGCASVDFMIQNGITGVDFIVINTDAQVLNKSLCERKVYISNGKQLGAGGNPKIGEEAAKQNEDKIRYEIQDADMVIIASGMGGGTGTGAAPVVAKIAKDLGILTTAIVTTPFSIEGELRLSIAKEGVVNLRASVDALLVVNNQLLIENNNIAFESSDMFDNVQAILKKNIKAITSIIVETGKINRDFNDVKSVLKDSGDMLVGIGEDESNVESAFTKALDMPLIDSNIDISKAKSAIAVLTMRKSEPFGTFTKFSELVQQYQIPDVKPGLFYCNEHQNKITVTILAGKFPKKYKRIPHHNSAFSPQPELNLTVPSPNTKNDLYPWRGREKKFLKREDI
jgi:cell division protein FtsZ